MRTNTTQMLAILALMALTTLASTASATTRFVSDQLSINMRQGPGTQYRITTMVKAGDRVQVLELDSGWSKVRTSDGTTGFVLTRFLSDHPSARDQVASMKSKVATLDQQNHDLKNKLAAALDNSSQLGDTKRTLATENASLKKQLGHIKEISANAVSINQQNQKLQKNLASAQHQAKALQQENQAHHNRREGMKVGALILGAGVILGLILPMLRRRRRGRWAL